MVKDRPLRTFLNDLAAPRPTTVSRWGDSAWRVLFGEAEGFCGDGMCAVARLRSALWGVLSRKPPYALTLATADRRAWNTIEASGWDRLDWWTDPWAEANRQWAEAAATVLSREPLVVLGPPGNRRLRKILKYTRYVDLPPQNAYLMVEELERAVLGEADACEAKAVAVTAGAVGPVLVDSLFRKIGTSTKIVDVGNLWSYLGE